MSTATPHCHASTVEQDGLVYQTGLGNQFESECIPGALPRGRNNPRMVPFGLYTEQLSGTAFTAPRAENRRVWLYRIQPSVTIGAAESLPQEQQFAGGCDPRACEAAIDPLRWHPYPVDGAAGVEYDFVSGLKLQCHAGDPAMREGLAIYLYSFGTNMKDLQTHFVDHDGELLIMPQQGSLDVLTELGRLIVHPTELVVIPRGVVFQVNHFEGESKGPIPGTSPTATARGYMLEVYKGGFALPELGPIGSNGLANARDFLHPVAWCVAQSDYEKPCSIVAKMQSQLYAKSSTHSPYNVVAWHGNYSPYKYNLERFCAVNSVTYDHLDPSIYTVLSCQSEHVGTALADVVLFPPRVLATDANTLRPPWFHRNVMSEYMGLLYGAYDAKESSGTDGAGGFVPGGSSLHNAMVPHGPDAATYVRAVADPCDAPVLLNRGLAFMFETYLPLRVNPQALRDEAWRDVDYTACWQDLTAAHFTGWDWVNGTVGTTREEDDR